jgi:hypothetical protein
MVELIGIILTAAAASISQPVFQAIGIEPAIAATQCSCCKNKACNCGMEKPQTSDSKKSQSSNSSEPCCGNSQPASQSENSAIIPFFSYSIKELQQNALVSVFRLTEFESANSETHYFVHSSSSPPHFSLSFPLRI